MASGKLILHGYKDNFGRQSVYIKLSHKKIVRLVETPEKVAGESLDKQKLETEKKFRILQTLPDARSINKRLEKLQFFCESVVMEFKYKPQNSFNSDDMKARCIELAEWKDTPVVHDESTFWEIAFNKWVSYRESEEGAAKGTIRGYASTKKVFSDFLSDIGKENIGIFEITGDMLNAWVTDMVKKGSDNATIKKHITKIRLCCHFHKHPEINREWKPKRKLNIVKKQGVSFTVEEINKLYNYQADAFFQPIKDMLFRFIASGVRWSDQDIDLIQRQGEFVMKRNQKNQNLSAIPINKYLLEILDKPKPQMSNTYFNKYVKKLCELAGIDAPVVKEKAPGGTITQKVVPKYERVSSKIGRKSMVSLLTAAGFTRPEIRLIIGNDSEIEAYEVVDLTDLAKKVQENFGGTLGG